MHTHTHTHKYVRWTSLPRKMGMPRIAGTLVMNYPLTLHDIPWDWRPQKTPIFHKILYHSCQLVENQNVMVLFVHLWFTQSFPDFPVQGITSFHVYFFWIILDHPSLQIFFSPFWLSDTVIWTDTPASYSDLQSNSKSVFRWIHKAVTGSDRQLCRVISLRLPIRQIRNMITPTRQTFMKVYTWSFS